MWSTTILTPCKSCVLCIVEVVKVTFVTFSRDEIIKLPLWMLTVSRKLLCDCSSISVCSVGWVEAEVSVKDRRSKGSTSYGLVEAHGWNAARAVARHSALPPPAAGGVTRTLDTHSARQSDRWLLALFVMTRMGQYEYTHLQMAYHQGHCPASHLTAAPLAQCHSPFSFPFLQPFLICSCFKFIPKTISLLSLVCFAFLHTAYLSSVGPTQLISALMS